MPVESRKVFFSYARADSKFVLRLAADMRSAGINLWLDQFDIPAGERWDEKVEMALTDCSCLLIILSPASVGSRNVMDEVEFAIDQSKRVFPVLHERCNLPLRLNRLHYIDFTGNYDKALARLIDELHADSRDKEKVTTPVKQHSRIGHPTKRWAIILVLSIFFGIAGGAWMAASDTFSRPLNADQEQPQMTADLIAGRWSGVAQDINGASFRIDVNIKPSVLHVDRKMRHDRRVSCSLLRRAVSAKNQ